MSEINQDTQSTGPSAPLGPIIARAGSYYRRTRYIMFVLLLGYGVWSIYDGFVGWPKHNQEWDRIDALQTEAEKAGDEQKKQAHIQAKAQLGERHSDFNVNFNRVVGVALPILAIVMLTVVLHRSRGEIRLENQVLTVPGHPPVPFAAITALDTRQWDRKGIAYVEYALPERKGRILLDDFIYEREPIDYIYDAIVRHLEAESGASGAPTDSAAQPSEN